MLLSEAQSPGSRRLGMLAPGLALHSALHLQASGWFPDRFSVAPSERSPAGL